MHSIPKCIYITPKMQCTVQQRNIATKLYAHQKCQCITYQFSLKSLGQPHYGVLYVGNKHALTAHRPFARRLGKWVHRELLQRTHEHSMGNKAMNWRLWIDCRTCVLSVSVTINCVNKSGSSFTVHVLLRLGWDEVHNGWDGSQLLPSQTPTNFFWLINTSVPKWKFW